MLHLAMAGYSATDMPFVPIWLANVWRAFLWAAELSLLTTFIVFMPQAWRRRHDEDPMMLEWTVWLYLGMGLFLIRSAVVQLERWDAPVLVENLPVTTVVLACWWRARWLRTGRWL
jgi:hypothetical protein